MNGAAISMEGYLEKRARKSGRNWKKRYFQLQAPYLTYRDAPGKKEKGRLLLSANTKCLDSDIDNKPFVIKIICDSTNGNSDTLYVSGSSNSEFKKWMEEIHIVASQLKDKMLSTQRNIPGPPPAGSLSSIKLPGPPPPPVSSLPGPPSSKPPPSLSSGECKSNSPVNTKLYSWGCNLNGQIGQSQSSYQNSSNPIHVEALKRKNSPAFAACGTNHTIAVTEKGMLFAFGDGKEGQLGCGERVSSSSRPYLLASIRSERCIQISASKEHNLAVMENGNVYVWGSGSKGCLGLGPDQLMVHLPTPIPTIGIQANISIGRLTCGGEHTVFLTRSGAVYVCGGNSIGQLGLGHKENIFVPTLVRSLVTSPVHDAAAGDCFTILSLKDTVGLKQVGFVGRSDIHEDGNEDGYARTNDTCLSFIDVPLPDMSQGDKILAVSAGAYHCGALVGIEGHELGGAERVYTWGEGIHGALGHGNENRVELPTRVEALEHCHAIQLSMGHEFSALLTTDDRLYLWGQGNNGQLGNGYYVNSLEPVLAKTPGDNKDIHWVSISCGEEHCVGVTADGAPRFDPDENTFVRKQHAKETALPEHHEEILVSQQLQDVLSSLGTATLSGGGGSGGGSQPPHATTSNSAPSLAVQPPTVAAPPPASARTPSIPTHWVYQDAAGNVQGPFETSMMKAWYENDQIYWNLMIRDASLPNNAPFTQLGQLYPDKTNSFQ